MTKQSDATKTAPINHVPTGVGIPAMWAPADYAKEVGILHGDMGAVQGRITDLTIQSLLHLEAHKDVATLNRFIVGMPKGYRRNALLSWTLAYGCVKINMDKGTNKSSPLAYDKTKVVKIEAAMAEPWYTHLPEKDPVLILDLQNAVRLLLRKASAGVQIVVNGKTLDPAVAYDKLVTLGALVGEVYKGELAPVLTPAPEVEAPKHTRRATDVKDPAEPAMELIDMAGAVDKMTARHKAKTKA